MANRTFCSSCGKPMDGSRQFCEQCGIFLGEASWAPRDAPVCMRCGAVNAPGRRDCGQCRTNLVTGFGDDWEGHVLYDPAPATRRPSGPLVEGACTMCGAVNPPGEPFCGNCGQFLEWDGAVASRAAPNDRPVEPS